jgi:predicted flavoprotein YhiN
LGLLVGTSACTGAFDHLKTAERYNGCRFKKAEVTGGGIRLDELDCKTMECKRFPSLFACGEICDVFGRIGGFNFYWAWTSGRAAGLGAANTDWTECDI